MSKQNHMIINISIAHLIVDAACIYTLYYGAINNNIDSKTTFFFIVLYNILAFGLQAPIGKFFDRNQNPKLSVIIGCILTAIGVTIWKYYIPASILVGLGNAFFHVGGGIISLKIGEQKATTSGFFVSTGSLGLFSGALLAQFKIGTPIYFIIFLSISAIIIYLSKLKLPETKPKTKQINNFLLVLNCLLFAIIIRSFIGLSINNDWKEDIFLVLYLTISICLGKMLGGIIADKFGWMKTTISALLISSPLIAFGINQPILFILGIFFFNFTMPVTLTAIANLMPKREGFAFGLTTLALLIGALPTFTNIKLGTENSTTIFIIVIFSAVLMYIGLKNYINCRFD